MNEGKREGRERVRVQLTVIAKKTKLRSLSSLLQVYIQIHTGFGVQLKCKVQVINPSTTIIGMSKNKDTDTSIKS
jgi:hypothetical protein